MGVQRRIGFPPGSVPEWPAIAANLGQVGEVPVVRMIDGLPAFPDEIPEPGWQELRLGLAGGMVTLRRTPDGFACVTWGNSDAGLTRSWDKLCWAVAAAGSDAFPDDPAGRTPADLRAGFD